MTTDHDPRTRIVLSWLREETHESAERVLLLALDEVDTTPQRRSWWPAWRTGRMSASAKLIAAAAAVLAVAVGFEFLPGNGGIGGQPTIAPLPSPMLLARGAFGAKGGEVELDATGDGDGVTGTMTVSHESGDFAVDLKCTRTAEDGRILIGGDTTDSTSIWVTKGARAAIVLKPGSPAHAVFEFEVGGLPAASCMAFLDGMIDTEWTTVIGPDGLEPIEGTVELGP